MTVKTTNLKRICGVSIASGGAEVTCTNCKQRAALILRGLPSTVSYYDRLGCYDEQVALTLFHMLDLQARMDVIIATLVAGEDVPVTEVEKLREYVRMLIALKAAQDNLELVANGFIEQFIEEEEHPSLDVREQLEPGLRLDAARSYLDRLVAYAEDSDDESPLQLFDGEVQVLTIGVHPCARLAEHTAAEKAS